MRFVRLSTRSKNGTHYPRAFVFRVPRKTEQWPLADQRQFTELRFCLNRRESLRFSVRIVIAFDCGSCGLSRSYPAARVGQPYGSFASSSVAGAKIEISQNTQVSHNQQFRMKPQLSNRSTTKFGKELAFSKKKPTGPSTRTTAVLTIL